MVIFKSHHFTHAFQTQQTIGRDAAKFRGLGTQRTLGTTQQDLGPRGTTTAAVAAAGHAVGRVSTGTVSGHIVVAVAVIVPGIVVATVALGWWAVHGVFRQRQQIVQGVQTAGAGGRTIASAIGAVPSRFE